VQADLKPQGVESGARCTQQAQRRQACVGGTGGFETRAGFHPHRAHFVDMDSYQAFYDFVCHIMQCALDKSGRRIQALPNRWSQYHLFKCNCPDFFKKLRFFWLACCAIAISRSRADISRPKSSSVVAGGAHQARGLRWGMLPR